MARDPVDWAVLLQAVESSIQNTSARIDADYTDLVANLDRLLDEVRSKEAIQSAELIGRFCRLLRKLFVYPNWHLVQTAEFGVGLVFDLLPEAAFEYLRGETRILDVLLSQLTGNKRELRDGAAQVLGTLARLYGASRFVNPLFPQILRATEETNDSWETLEGFANAIGRILASCSDLEKPIFGQMFRILLRLTAHDKGDSYSSYVRRYALRSLSLVFRSELSLQRLEEEPSFVADGVSVLSKRFQDGSIDVRREVGGCFVSLSVARERIDGGAVAVKEAVAILLKCFRDCPSSYEAVHGTASAAALLFEEVALVRFLPASSLMDLANELFLSVDHLKARRTGLSLTVTSAGSAAALNALVRLFLAVDGSNGSTDLADLMSRLSLESGSLPFFDRFVHPALIQALTSQVPVLLDAAAQGATICMKQGHHLNGFSEIAKHVFKNQFHASLPIQVSASRFLSLFCPSGAEKDSYMLKEGVLVLHLLLDEISLYSDPEVLEALFKGVGDLVSNSFVFESLEKEENLAENVLSSVLRGGKPVKGVAGDFEYARAAAVAALSAFLASLTAKSSREISVRVRDEIPSYLRELVTDEFEAVGAEAVRAIACLKRADEAFGSPHNVVDALFGPLLCLCAWPCDSVRLAAMPVLLECFGNVDRSFAMRPALAISAANGFVGEFSTDPSVCEDDDNRLAVARSLRLLVARPSFVRALSGAGENVRQKAFSRLLECAVDAMLKEENELDFLVNGAGTLLYLLRSGVSSFAESVVNRPDFRRVLVACVKRLFEPWGDCPEIEFPPIEENLSESDSDDSSDSEDVEYSFENDVPVGQIPDQYSLILLAAAELWCKCRPVVGDEMAVEFEEKLSGFLSTLPPSCEAALALIAQRLEIEWESPSIENAPPTFGSLTADLRSYVGKGKEIPFLLNPEKLLSAESLVSDLLALAHPVPWSSGESVEGVVDFGQLDPLFIRCAFRNSIVRVWKGVGDCVSPAVRFVDQVKDFGIQRDGDRNPEALDVFVCATFALDAVLSDVGFIRSAEASLVTPLLTALCDRSAGEMGVECLVLAKFLSRLLECIPPTGGAAEDLPLGIVRILGLLGDSQLRSKLESQPLLALLELCCVAARRAQFTPKILLQTLSNVIADEDVGIEEKFYVLFPVLQVLVDLDGACLVLPSPTAVSCVANEGFVGE